MSEMKPDPKERTNAGDVPSTMETQKPTNPIFEAFNQNREALLQVSRNNPENPVLTLMVNELVNRADEAADKARLAANNAEWITILGSAGTAGILVFAGVGYITDFFVLCSLPISAGAAVLGGRYGEWRFKDYVEGVRDRGMLNANRILEKALVRPK